ncbi:MAG: response regulator [Rhodocyclaceae bacterium]|jgi:CheY-like chemotaxis protein|nr:response regulator [Rhodocyclaceae bacterium]
MSSPFRVFAVDDDPVVLEIIQSMLDPDCAVTCFTSAEECLDALPEGPPEMFLLDVVLPGIDGYALCRTLKDDPAFASIPVVFVSAQDTIDARLRGYDAGGEDFIVKPFEPEELLRKVKVAKQIVLQQRALKEQLEAAEYLSSLALASMDETGILVQFMSKLIAWETVGETAFGLLELLQRYRLDGVVQTRIGDRSETISAAGTNLPLEVSVIEHVRGMGRIFEFRKRSVHNFERITLMINNLPLDDPEYCGRLRDHLSVAAQAVDSRLKAIETEEAIQRSQAGILEALDNVRSSIIALGEASRSQREATQAKVLQLEELLVNSFYGLGLTDNQEKFLLDLVGNFVKEMVAQLDRGNEAQTVLEELGNQLEALRVG